MSWWRRWFTESGRGVNQRVRGSAGSHESRRRAVQLAPVKPVVEPPKAEVPWRVDERVRTGDPAGMMALLSYLDAYAQLQGRSRQRHGVVLPIQRYTEFVQETGPVYLSTNEPGDSV